MDIIIFDYDGVIADSLDYVISLYNDLSSKYGLPKLKNQEEFTELFDGNFFEGLKENGIDLKVSQELLPEMADQMAQNADKTPVFKGVKKVLEELSQNYKLMIITSNLSRVIESALEKNDIKVIEEVVGADKEKSKVRKIKRIEKKYPESKIYYVGDTTGDIYEGREAGVTTVAVSWGFHSGKKMNSSRPDYLVNKPEELLDIFK